MNPLYRSARRIASTIGLSAALLGLSAAPALAAPSYEVDLRREAHESQVVLIKATAGQFKLSFGASTTANLAFNASAAQVQSALNALPSISTGGGSVTVSILGSAGSYRVDFTGGPLANTDVPRLGISDGTTPLSGGFASATATTLYKSGTSRSDTRVDYTVKVKNIAANSPVAAGEKLTCEPSTWTGNGTPAFTYKWLRNGVAIGGATATTYTTVAPADQGAAIQCQVTAINTVADVSNAADFLGSTRISAAVIVDPQPATAPPTPPSTIATPAQTAALDGTATQELTCSAGTWTGTPTEFTYQWYRNGVPLGAAVGPTAETSNKLTLTAAEQSPPAAFQCTVTGANAGGARSKASGNRTTAATLTPNPAAPDNANTLFIVKPNETSGPVTVEVELPAGLETTVAKVYDPATGTAQGPVSGIGWTCTSQAAAGIQPAKVTCTRSNVLGTGASYPTFGIGAGIGADMPDHAVAKATVSGGGGATVSDSEAFDFTAAKEFGYEAFDSEVLDSNGNDYTQAGGHPFFASTDFNFTTRSVGIQVHETIKTPRKVVIDLPRGLVGNALAVPKLCPTVDDVMASTCPAGSAVGEVNLDVVVSTDLTQIKMPIFAIEPEFGLPAQFAFAELAVIQTPFTLSPHLRADDGYAISLEATPAPASFATLRRVNWGALCSFGANVTGNSFKGCKDSSDLTANPVPLTTNPTRCAGTPPTVVVNTDSWQSPGDFVSAEVSDPLPTGCDKVDFQPEVSLEPTNQQADTPTGVDVEITMPTDGLESKTGLGQSNLDNAIVTFPKGMSLNPAAAHGLGNCTPAQVKLGSNAEDECPLSSQVGTIEIDTPLIRETLTGHVFLASQKDNPLKSTLGIYLVFASKKDGVTIKVAGELKADPVTGQLTSSFVENPEAPFSRLAIKFNSGPRAPLVNPPKCGTYAIHSEMSPWSAASPANPTPEEIAAADSTYQVTSGPNGAPCPDGALDPHLEAGVKNAVAGSKSPFVLKLTRDDGTKRFTGLNLDMPQGFTAYLKGIPYCPDHVLAGISGEELTGRPELASSACPAASQIGTIQAGAGAGPYPFYAQGRVFLAGPYKGAPLSMAVVGPAVAGPFDFGNVVVRNALYVDPITAKVSVVSDPIPTMLHGILLDIRDIRVNVNRPNFTASPTNCEEKSIDAHIGGEEGTNANRSNRFQVGDCAALGFEPKLNMRLFGGTKRGAHPKFRAILKPREGDANIAGASVALPHSEFLDQAHIRTVCTRVQFAAKACPAGSIYGHAEATSPLLDNPVTGPVYLRSSSHQLPDLVVALRGPDSQPIEVQLAGRVDSVNGGIRSTFELVPDQPVSSFVLTMQGGKKGLLVNSRDLCQGPAAKATAVFLGQNGKSSTSRPKLENSCGQARKGKKHKGASKRHHG